MITLILGFLLQLILLSLQVVNLSLVREDLFAKAKSNSIISLGISTTTVFHVENTKHSVSAD